jgi:hypothetical protein
MPLDSQPCPFTTHDPGPSEEHSACLLDLIWMLKLLQHQRHGGKWWSISDRVSIKKDLRLEKY